MLPIRIKACSESDLRMLGNLARNIQRVLPVTQADIDAAAALGKGWVVWKVIEVNDPIDNLRGGTQLVIKQNSITPGQNVRRVLIVSGPGGQVVVIGPDKSPLLLPDAIADTLSYVKAFGGTEQRDIPDNYLQRQFIYMMDGSYLLTDIVPTFAGHYELEMQTTSVTTGAVTYLGSRDESSGNGGLRFAHISDKTFRIAGFGALSTSSGTAADNTKYKFIWDNGSFWVYSGTTLIHSGTFTEETMPTTTPLAINGWNSGGTISGNIEGIYLYSFKVWNGQGELIANYVPAVEKAAVPVVGFYDTVSKTFKTATAGTFAAGGEAVPTPDTPMDIVSNNGVLKARHQSGLPLGYTALEYIESTGTQYIDTGVSGNATIKITAQASTIKGSSQALLSSTSGASGGTWVGEFTTNKKWGIGSGAGLTTIDPTTKMTAEIAFDRSGCSGTVNGESITRSATITQGGWTIMATSQLDYPFSGKVWGCQITQSGTLVRNFVPCKNSSNVVGMYDLVNGVFYQNAGTGTFTAGTAVSDPVEIYADGLQETINVHSKNLFDESDVITGKILNDTGAEVTQSAGYYSGHISVDANTVYTISQTGGEEIYLRILEYDSTDTMVKLNKGTQTGTQTKTFTTGATTTYVIVSGSTKSNALNTLQLERGSTATTYAPYFNGGTAVAEMLLKISDYQDVQSIIDGVVTRNVGVRVLDGTESWQLSSNRFRCQNLVPVSESNVMMCSHFAFTGNLTTDNTIYRATESAWTQIRYDTANNDVTVFKTFLADQYAAGTPVIVIYPLATPTTESVTGQTLQVQDGDNTLEITQASLSGLELEAEYEKVA